MKRKLVLLLALTLLLAMLATGSVFAQSPGGLSYTSGVQVVNLSGSTANIGLSYYDQNGNQVATPSDTIPANSSKTYFPIHAAAGFNGSLVVSSDQPVTAIANTITTDFSYGAATTSFSSGSTSVSLPLIMCNNSGFDTWFNVQNAGGSTANITIQYNPGSDGTADSETDSLPLGTAHTYDQATGSSTVNCSSLADPTTNKFIGSAQVTSDQPVVATVMQLNTSGFNVLMGYNGFSSGGSTTVTLPLIMAKNNGFYTGYQIQNVGGGSTTATISYSPNQVNNGFNPSNDSCSGLSAGESCTLIQNGGQWTQQYIGSATVTASQPLVVIVNQVSLGGGGAGPFGTAYEGFDPAGASSDVVAPLIMANNSGYYTGVQVMNVGSNCANVTIDYGPNLAGAFNPANVNFSLNANQSNTVIQNGGSWGSNKYIGSADISAPGCDIVAIVNEVAIKAGDNFFTYIGYNK